MCSTFLPQAGAMQNSSHSGSCLLVVRANTLRVHAFQYAVSTQDHKHDFKSRNATYSGFGYFGPIGTGLISWKELCGALPYSRQTCRIRLGCNRSEQHPARIRILDTCICRRITKGLANWLSGFVQSCYRVMEGSYGVYRGPVNFKAHP